MTALANATGVETRLTTNADGAYTFNSLPIGIYTITVAASGFTTASRTEVRSVSGESALVDHKSVAEAALEVGADDLHSQDGVVQVLTEPAQVVQAEDAQ